MDTNGTLKCDDNYFKFNSEFPKTKSSIGSPKDAGIKKDLENNMDRDQIVEQVSSDEMPMLVAELPTSSESDENIGAWEYRRFVSEEFERLTESVQQTLLSQDNPDSSWSLNQGENQCLIPLIEEDSDMEEFKNVKNLQTPITCQGSAKHDSHALEIDLLEKVVIQLNQYLDNNHSDSVSCESLKNTSIPNASERDSEISSIQKESKLTNLQTSIICQAGDEHNLIESVDELKLNQSLDKRQLGELTCEVVKNTIILNPSEGDSKISPTLKEKNLKNLQKPIVCQRIAKHDSREIETNLLENFDVLQLNQNLDNNHVDSVTCKSINSTFIPNPREGDLEINPIVKEKKIANLHTAVICQAGDEHDLLERVCDLQLNQSLDSYLSDAFARKNIKKSFISSPKNEISKTLINTNNDYQDSFQALNLISPGKRKETISTVIFNENIINVNKDNENKENKNLQNSPPSQQKRSGKAENSVNVNDRAEETANDYTEENVSTDLITKCGEEDFSRKSDNDEGFNGSNEIQSSENEADSQNKETIDSGAEPLENDSLTNKKNLEMSFTDPSDSEAIASWDREASQEISAIKFHPPLKKHVRFVEKSDLNHENLRMEPVAANKKKDMRILPETQHDLATALRFMTEAYPRSETDDHLTDSLSNFQDPLNIRSSSQENLSSAEMFKEGKRHHSDEDLTSENEKNRTLSRKAPHDTSLEKRKNSKIKSSTFSKLFSIFRKKKTK